MTKFLPIPDFPGYRVGDNGAVQSAWQRKSNGGRNGTRAVIGTAWNTIVPRTHSKGYLLVSIRHKSGKRRLRYVHQLVLELFRGPRPKGHFGCHRDDDPKNNRLTNLRWGTPSSNQADWRGKLPTIDVDGCIMTVWEWSQVSGVHPKTIRARLRAGWPNRSAVFSAVQKRSASA